ncbi:MAG TPA: Crp/Fnr family transcriptional regulator [Puia sp.]|nr:Crp/Fnr family transcriptional regulator [Puia sp.]
MEKLLTLLNSIAEIPPGLAELLQANLQCREFSKGDYILKEGEVCSNIYFLESGLIRIFNRLSEKEVTSWFLMEGDIFISVSSFFRQQPSYENIVALEDCVCWGISYEQLKNACLLYPAFNAHRIAITEIYYCRSEDRHYIKLRKPPDERYADLVEEESELLNRVPLQLLPSYLDVSRSAFTRIRNNYYYIKRKGISLKQKRPI